MTERFTPARSTTRAPAVVTVCVAVLASLSCGTPDPDLIPDEVLQATLGLAEGDRVHTVTVTTGVGERSEPDTVVVRPGDLVQFVTTDWFVHEVRFDVEALDPAARSFLVRTAQMASPPLLQRDARFVVSFADAPEGRYPYVLVGNRASGAGAVVVTTIDPSDG